jgi:hypothetical protein
VKREKWNRGDSLDPSPGFDCQSISQCNVILARLEKRLRKTVGRASKDSIMVEPATHMLLSDLMQLIFMDLPHNPAWDNQKGFHADANKWQATMTGL